jgi:hypothetical protein
MPLKKRKTEVNDTAKQGCGSRFNELVDPDPDFESGSRVQKMK